MYRTTYSLQLRCDILKLMNPFPRRISPQISTHGSFPTLLICTRSHRLYSVNSLHFIGLHSTSSHKLSRPLNEREHFLPPSRLRLRGRPLSVRVSTLYLDVVSQQNQQPASHRYVSPTSYNPGIYLNVNLILCGAREFIST